MAGKRVLMVEGKDDEHVVKHICGQRALGNIDTIHAYGGRDPLLGAIDVRLKESGIEALGILLDADSNLLASWDAIKHHLQQAGYTCPESPSERGTVLEPPADTLLPRVGVWLMPNNKIPGILEDFLSFLVPAGDPLFEHARNSVQNIPMDCCRFPEVRKPKALIHTWLAWQEEPGRPLGQAISAKYIDPAVAEANHFCGWLTETFFA